MRLAKHKISSKCNSCRYFYVCCPSWAIIWMRLMCIWCEMMSALLVAVCSRLCQASVYLTPCRHLTTVLIDNILCRPQDLLMLIVSFNGNQKYQINVCPEQMQHFQSDLCFLMHFGLKYIHLWMCECVLVWVSACVGGWLLYIHYLEQR